MTYRRRVQSVIMPRHRARAASQDIYVPSTGTAWLRLSGNGTVREYQALMGGKFYPLDVGEIDGLNSMSGLLATLSSERAGFDEDEEEISMYDAVQNKGVVNDGSANTTTLLEQARDAIQPGETLWLKEGLYRITPGFDLRGRHLRGASAPGNSTSAGTVIYCDPAGGADARMVIDTGLQGGSRITGITFWGNGVAQHAFWGQSSSSVYGIINCIGAVSHGFFYEAGQVNVAGILSCYSNGGDGARVVGCNAGNIRALNTRTNTGYGYNVRGAFTSGNFTYGDYAGSPITAGDVYVHNIGADGNVAGSACIDGALGGSLENGHLENPAVARDGVHAINNAQGFLFKNLRIVGPPIGPYAAVAMRCTNIKRSVFMNLIANGTVDSFLDDGFNRIRMNAENCRGNVFIGAVRESQLVDQPLRLAFHNTAETAIWVAEQSANGGLRSAAAPPAGIAAMFQEGDPVWKNAIAGAGVSPGWQFTAAGWRPMAVLG